MRRLRHRPVPVLRPPVGPEKAPDAVPPQTVRFQLEHLQPTGRSVRGGQRLVIEAGSLEAALAGRHVGGVVDDVDDVHRKKRSASRQSVRRAVADVVAVGLDGEVHISAPYAEGHRAGATTQRLVLDGLYHQQCGLSEGCSDGVLILRVDADGSANAADGNGFPCPSSSSCFGRLLRVRVADSSWRSSLGWLWVSHTDLCFFCCDFILC
mmetsp:Transcript_36165/g.66714  ORF Transcript_36165/g.66714 Transcript_36165/m.66714 type:complete len:209 (-) Transcript_36165:1196-1822(-)